MRVITGVILLFVTSLSNAAADPVVVNADHPLHGEWDFAPVQVWKVDEVLGEPLTQVSTIRLAADGRIYAVASSEDSIDSAAKLGAHMVMFADRPWEMRKPMIEKGRELHPLICYG